MKINGHGFYFLAPITINLAPKYKIYLLVQTIFLLQTSEVDQKSAKGLSQMNNIPSVQLMNLTQII